MNVAKSCSKKITCWSLGVIFETLWGRRRQRHQLGSTSFQLRMSVSVYTHTVVITIVSFS